MQDLQARLGLTYLFIAHDLAVVRHIADRVAIMQSGRIVEIGPVAQVYSDPQHAYTRQLLASVPELGDAPAAVARA
jgi:ABC-type oligopeptide transport system ATPase subunit